MAGRATRWEPGEHPGHNERRGPSASRGPALRCGGEGTHGAYLGYLVTGMTAPLDRQVDGRVVRLVAYYACRWRGGRGVAGER